MNQEDLRLECLRLAHATHESRGDVIERARAYADFVLGERDAEIIDAARVLATKLAA